jgi:hypothetical protein
VGKTLSLKREMMMQVILKTQRLEEELEEAIAMAT